MNVRLLNTNHYLRRIRPTFYRRCSHEVDCIEQTRILSQTEVDQFATLVGDTNIIHSVTYPPEKRCVHGAFLNGIVSGIIGTQLPGPGSIVLSQTFQFPNKCVCDKEIKINVKLVENRKIKKIAYNCVQENRVVFSGTAEIIVRKTNEI